MPASDRECINAPYIHRYIIIGGAAWLPLVAFLGLNVLWLPAGSNNWLAAFLTFAGNLLAIGVATFAFLHYQWSLCLSDDRVTFGRWIDQLGGDRQSQYAKQELRRIVIYQPRWVDIELQSGHTTRLGTLLWRTRDLDALDRASRHHGVRVVRLTQTDAGNA